MNNMKLIISNVNVFDHLIPYALKEYIHWSPTDLISILNSNLTTLTVVTLDKSPFRHSISSPAS